MAKGLGTVAPPPPPRQPTSFVDAVRLRREMVTSGQKVEPVQRIPQNFIEEVRYRREAAIQPVVEQKQEANRTYESIRSDLEALGQDTPDKVRNWGNVAATVVRLAESEDEDARNYASALMAQYQNQLRPQVDLQAGEQWWDENFKDPTDIGGWRGVLADVLNNPVVSTTLEILDRPSQGVLHGIRGITAALDPNDGIDAGEAWRYTGSSLANVFNPAEDFNDRRISFGDGQTLSFDNTGDGVLNFREAIGMQGNEGGRWAGLLDTAAVIATDPTTYLSFGATGFVRAMGDNLLAVAGRLGNGADVAADAALRTARRYGRKALTDQQNELLNTLAMHSARESAMVRAGQLTDPGVIRRTMANVRRFDNDIARATQKRYDRYQKALDRGVRSGVRFAGRTVVPYSPMTGFLERVGVIGQYAGRTSAVVPPVDLLEDLLDDSVFPFNELRAILPPQAPMAEGVWFDTAEEAASGVRVGAPGPSAGTPPPRPPGGPGASARTETDELVDKMLRIYESGDVDDEIRWQLLEEISTRPDLWVRLGIKDQDIIDVADRLVERSRLRNTPPPRALGAAPEPPAPPPPPTRKPSVVVPRADESRFEAARRWMRNRNRANTRRLQTAEPIPMEPTVGAPFTARAAGPVEPTVIDDLVGVPLAWEPRRITRPELRALNDMGTPERAVSNGLERWTGTPRARSRHEKELLLELENRGLEPFYDAAADRYAVRIGDDTLYVQPVGRFREGAVLMPEERLLPVAQELPDKAARADRIRNLVRERRGPDPQMGELGPAPRDLSPAMTHSRRAADDDFVDEVADPIFEPPTPPSRKELPRVRNRELLPGSTPRTLDEAEQLLAETRDRVASILSEIEPERLIYVRGAIDKLLDARFIAAFREKFIPRTRLNRNAAIGRRGAQMLDDVSAESAGRFITRIDDMLRRLDSQLMHDAGRQVGGADEWNRIVNRALDNPTAFKAEREALQAAGFDKAVKALDDLNEMRREIYEATVRGGGTRLRQADNYIPRYLNREAAERLEKRAAQDPQLAGRLGRLGVMRNGRLDIGELSDAVEQARQQGGSLRARTFNPETQDLLSLNEQAAAMLRDLGLDPKEIGDLFEDNVLAAFALRARSAYEAVMTTDMIEGLTDGVDNLGHRYAYLGSKAEVEAQMAADGAVAASMRQVDMGGGQVAYVNSVIYDEMLETRRVIGSTREMNKFLQHLNQWNGLWSSYATVPLVGGAFHMRNAVGNLFNNFLAGLKNPRHYASAFRLQRLDNRIHREMSRTGQSFADAARSIKANKSDLSLLMSARERGIIGTGQTSDIFTESRTSLRKRGQRWNPLNQKFGLIASGRRVGEAVEHNARLALYIDGLERGLGQRAAASRVRKYLFDYSDLTRFENNVLRSLSRFYTYTRKNFALQATHLAMYPGSVLNAQRISEAWLEFWMGDEDTEGFMGVLPDWARGAAGQVFNYDSMGRSGTALVGLDTPLEQFGDTVGNLGASLSAIPVLGDNVPDALGGWGTREDRVARAMTLLSGGPVSMVNFLFGERYGRDPFSGRILDQDGVSQTIRFLSTFAPVVSKVDREWTRGNENWQLRMANWLLGFDTYDLSSEQQDRAIRSLRWEAGQQLNELADRGIEAPSMADLEKAGKIAQQNRALMALISWDPNQPGLTPEQRTEFQIKLNEEMDSILGNEVIEAAGMVRQTMTAPAGEMTTEEKILRMEEYALALDRRRADQGMPPLTEEEKARVLLATSLAPDTTELKDVYLEPYTTANRFTSQASPETLQADTIAELELLGQQWGLSYERIRQLRPLLPDAQRVLQEAQAAGLPPEAGVQYLISELGRREQGILFGTDSLPMFRDGSITPEQRRAVQNRAWERASEFTIIYRAVTGQMPRESDVWKYVYWNELTKGDQERLGLEEGPVIPSQKDVRTEDMRVRDALLEAESALVGMRSGPSR